MAIKQSERLQRRVETWLSADVDPDDLYEAADSTCTTGYDNDGSTGYEIFENGFGLAEYAAGRDVWVVRHPDALVA